MSEQAHIPLVIELPKKAMHRMRNIRAVLRDDRISLGAKGLFVLIMDLPDNWGARPSHIAEFTKTGKHLLSTYRKELEGVGGLRVEPIRLSDKEAAALNARDSKCYRAGHVVGTRWVLADPKLWAIEQSLTKKRKEQSRVAGSPPVDDADGRQPRDSNNRPVRYSMNCKGVEQEKQQDGNLQNAATPCSDLTQPRRRRGDETIEHGVEIWTDSDIARLKSLIAKFGVARVEGVAASLTPAAGHLAPYVSAVIKAIDVAMSKDQRDAEMKQQIGKLSADSPTSKAVAQAHISKMKNALGKKNLE